MQQLLRERIVHHLGDLLLAHADLLSASEGLSVPNLGGCAIHPSAGKRNSRKFWPSRARSRQTAPHSSGLPTRRTLILCVRTTRAPKELHVVCDHINLAPLRSVLGLPGAVL